MHVVLPCLYVGFVFRGGGSRSSYSFRRSTCPDKTIPFRRQQEPCAGNATVPLVRRMLVAGWRRLFPFFLSSSHHTAHTHTALALGFCTHLNPLPPCWLSIYLSVLACLLLLHVVCMPSSSRPRASLSWSKRSFFSFLCRIDFPHNLP